MRGTLSIMRRIVLVSALLLASIVAAQERSPDGLWEVMAPNNGRARATLPVSTAGTANARIRIESIGNVFFADSESFAIIL